MLCSSFWKYIYQWVSMLAQLNGHESSISIPYLAIIQWEGLAATCRWSWVTPGRCPVSSLHPAGCLCISEIFLNNEEKGNLFTKNTFWPMKCYNMKLSFLDRTPSLTACPPMWYLHTSSDRLLPLQTMIIITSSTGLESKCRLCHRLRILRRVAPIMIGSIAETLILN